MAKRSHLLSFSGLHALMRGGAISAGAPAPAAHPAAAIDGAVAPPDDPEGQPDEETTPPTPPPPSEPGDGDDNAAAASGPIVLASDALRLANQARADERARFGAVLASAEGKANLTNAIFLLSHSDASAADIIATLKTAPAAAAAVAQPRIILNRQNGTGSATVEQNGEAGEPGASFDPWATVQAKTTPAAAGTGAAVAAAAAGLTAPVLTR